MKKVPVTWITGSGTDVGKTVLTVNLLQAARAQGRELVALKPFCSGPPEDVLRILKVSPDGLNFGDVCPWHFEDPVSPADAAARVDRAVSQEQLLHFVDGMHQRFPHLVCEGAGGLHSPLGRDWDLGDVLRQIPSRVLCVVPNRLGAQHESKAHAHLLRLLGLPSESWRIVLSGTRAPVHVQELNRQFLDRFLGAQGWIDLPFLEDGMELPQAVATALFSFVFDDF